MDNQIFQALFVKKTFSIELFLLLCQKTVNSLQIWTLYSFRLIFLSILSPILCCFDYCNFILSLKIGQYYSSNFALLIQHIIEYYRSLVFLHKLVKQLLIHAKQLAIILIEIVFNLQIKVERIVILIILVLLIHDHEILFFLLRSLISFMKVLQLFASNFLTYFANLHLCVSLFWHYCDFFLNFKF